MSLRSDEAICDGFDENAFFPNGVRLYSLSETGNIILRDSNGISSLHAGTLPLELFPFINEGNIAVYFIGDPKTNMNNPTNATFKVSVTEPSGSFEPHMHGVGHYVIPHGRASCVIGQTKLTKAKITTLRMWDGDILHIEGGVAHALYNPSPSEPLTCTVINEGLGLDDENYAITHEDIAERIRNLSPEEGSNLRRLRLEEVLLQRIEEYMFTWKIRRQP